MPDREFGTRSDVKSGCKTSLRRERKECFCLRLSCSFLTFCDKSPFLFFSQYDCCTTRCILGLHGNQTVDTTGARICRSGSDATAFDLIR